jgi:hypothetical protein
MILCKVNLGSGRTVAAAKRRAEHIYPGSTACWVEANFTDEEANRYLNELFGDQQ